MIGQVLNLGNPTEFTLAETLALFEDVIGRKLPSVQKPAPPEDPVRRCPDIRKAKEMLGWEPKINFRHGLQLMLNTYKVSPTL